MRCSGSKAVECQCGMRNAPLMCAGRWNEEADDLWERCECTGEGLNAGLAQGHDKKPVR